MTFDPIPRDLTVFIAREAGTLMTDSRAVALAFGKKHKNVLRLIESVLSSRRQEIADHARLNFQPSSYLDPLGKRQRMYRMTAEGLYAMNLRGESAREVRIRFLNAFEEVAARLMRAERSLVQQLEALEQLQPRLRPH